MSVINALQRQLEGAFTGELVLDGDVGYETARRVWNGMVDRRPAVIARCAGERDVVLALEAAREQGRCGCARRGP